jgi:hypothetical protein
MVICLEIILFIMFLGVRCSFQLLWSCVRFDHCGFVVSLNRYVFMFLFITSFLVFLLVTMVLCFFILFCSCIIFGHCGFVLS